MAAAALEGVRVVAGVGGDQGIGDLIAGRVNAGIKGVNVGPPLLQQQAGRVVGAKQTLTGPPRQSPGSGGGTLRRRASKQRSAKGISLPSS